MGKTPKYILRSAREEWARFNCRDIGLNLSHWMPLPLPPSE